MATPTQTGGGARQAPLIDLEDDQQLEAARHLVVGYLNEAHATETALITTLQAHIAMTPRGSYRELLERHLDETRGHAQAIERRLSEIGQGPGVVTAVVGLFDHLVGQVLSLSKGPIDAIRGASGEEKLLKNARDECATEALEIAHYDALETAARAVGDDKTAELARRHRDDEERMLDGLRREIPQLAVATVRERVGGEMIYDPAATGVADNVRDLGERARSAASEAADAADAAVDGTDLPIEDYDRLTAGEVISRLPRLSDEELRRVEDYERTHRNRSTVVTRIEALREQRARA
jgi:ferritin-like metal-binding protein YciE